MDGFSPSSEFAVGDFVFYPIHGVGRIQKIDEQEVAGIKLELFVIGFEKHKMILRVPMTKAKAVGMRKPTPMEIVEAKRPTSELGSQTNAPVIRPSSPPIADERPLLPAANGVQSSKAGQAMTTRENIKTVSYVVGCAYAMIGSLHFIWAIVATRIDCISRDGVIGVFWCNAIGSDSGIVMGVRALAWPLNYF